MSPGGATGLSLRLERAEYSRLAWAFGLSLAVHLLIFGTYQAGKRFHWWDNWAWPSWVKTPMMLTQLLQKKPDLLKEQKQEMPLMFVDVSSAVSTPDPPPEAKFYSDKNSKAANPDPPPVETQVPKIDGKQTEVVKTEDVPRTQAFPLQPTPPPSPPQEEIKESQETQETQEEVKAEPKPVVGDLAMAKPEPEPRPAQEPKPKTRPRTLKEAYARNPESALTGRKMKQDGGVRRTSLVSSLDAVKTPFGAYDAAIVAAVQNRWYFLLDERKFLGENTGRVQLKFRLNSDGTVSEMKLVDSTVDYTLAVVCQSAVRDPAPYAPWPGDMKRLVGADFREVTFTFYYY
jgi:hypothetical protein